MKTILLAVLAAATSVAAGVALRELRRRVRDDLRLQASIRRLAPPGLGVGAVPSP